MGSSAEVELVAQQHLWPDSQRARQAQSLLLAQRQPRRGGGQPIFDLVPQPRRLQLRRDQRVEIAVGQPVDARAVSHVVEDRHGQRERLLRQQPDPRADLGHVDARRVDVLAVEQDLAFDAHAVVQLRQPVEALEQRRLAAAGWPDDSGDLSPGDVGADVFQRVLRAVPYVQPAYREVRCCQCVHPMSLQSTHLRVGDSVHRLHRFHGLGSGKSVASV